MQKKASIATSAGMLYRFVHEVQEGDYAVFPSKIDRKINIGIVESAYFYDAATLYPNRRKVKWLKHLPRTAFSQGALHEVGSSLSFFQVKNYADEYLKALDKNFKGDIVEPDTDETVAQTADEIIEATRDFILKELSKNLKGYDLEPFVANLLQAMGYRTILSPHGGDRGIDITAYKDELPPRIVVQVKSQDGDIKESTIQSLKGAMREGDYGLFVTLSNYTHKWAFREYIANHDADFCIPPKSNECDPWYCDWWLYNERHLVENFFLKLKEFRRVATRYDKLACRFLGFVLLACIRILLA